MSLAQFWPLIVHGEYSGSVTVFGSATPSCVALPAVRSASVAVPSWIFLTRPAFSVGGAPPRHTLASNWSRHALPTETESVAHDGLPFCAPAGLDISASAATVVIIRNIIDPFSQAREEGRGERAGGLAPPCALEPDLTVFSARPVVGGTRRPLDAGGDPR